MEVQSEQKFNTTTDAELMYRERQEDEREDKEDGRLAH